MQPLVMRLIIESEASYVKSVTAEKNNHFCAKYHIKMGYLHANT